MVIQRIQSLWLLIAAVVMGVFPFVNFGTGYLEGEVLNLCPIGDYMMTLVTGVLAAVLYLIDIFLYNNFKLQKSVLAIAQLMSVVTAGLVIYYNLAASSNGWAVTWVTGCYLLIVALVMGMMARRGIVHDEKLLKSADRLR